MRSNESMLRLRRGFPPAYFCILLAFSLAHAWGITASLRPGNTLGNALLGAFGGCIWAVEVDLHACIGWMAGYLPMGIAACIAVSQHMAGWMRMAGYRYRSALHWYGAFMGDVMLAACVAAVIQILCVLLIAAGRGYTGWGIWVDDADGFSVQNRLLPCLAPLLFLLYGEVITLTAVDAFLVLRKMSWYYAVFLLPSLVGCVGFSKPAERFLWIPVHFGMAHRLSVEGGFGVQPAVACGGLMMLLTALLIVGGAYCRFSPPFDRSYE